MDFVKRKMAIRESMISLFDSTKQEICKFIDGYRIEKLRQFDTLSDDINAVVAMMHQVKSQFDQDKGKEENSLKEISKFITKKMETLPLDFADISLFSK